MWERREFHNPADQAYIHVQVGFNTNSQHTEPRSEIQQAASSSCGAGKTYRPQNDVVLGMDRRTMEITRSIDCGLRIYCPEACAT